MALTTDKTPVSPAETGVFAAAATALRILPTLLVLPFNFAPVGGFAAFSGARVRAWLAYLAPLVVMVVSDCVLWALKGDLYSPLHVSRPMVYGSFLLYVVLGRLLGRWGLLGLGAAAVLGSVQFFLLTNFASWVELVDVYPRNWAGLIAAYDAGIPFYQSTLLSDVCFAFAFLAAHLIWQRLAQPAPRPVEASQS